MPERRPGQGQPLKRGETHLGWCTWAIVFLSAFLLYGLTANRGAQGVDSGEFILRIVEGELIDSKGLALTHPLHHWLGRLAISTDLLEPCFAITLISAFAAAIAVANVCGCVCTLTRSHWAALFSAASLAIAHTFWQLSTRTEVYTLTAALFAGECWCLAAYARQQRPIYLWGMLLLNGLGIGNHMQAALTTPVLVFVLVHAVRTKRAEFKEVCIGALIWLVGSLPYTGLVCAELVRTGDASATLRSALVGQSFGQAVLNIGLSGKQLMVSAAFVILNLPNLLLPAAIYGIGRAASLGVPTLARRAFLASLLIHACFVVRYPVVDQHTFFIPVYVLIAIFGGLGFAAVSQWELSWPRRTLRWAAIVSLVATPILYAFTPPVARHFDILGGIARNKPYRDDYVHIFTPWSLVERSVETMSRHAVDLAGERGLIVVEDPSLESAIRYRALRDGMDDQIIGSDIALAGIAEAVDAGRAVVLVPLNVDAPRTEPPLGTWKRDGDLYVFEAVPSNP